MIEGQQIPVSKEVFSTTGETVALQTRLVLGGETLNPKSINLGKVTPDQLSAIKPETVSKINQASTKERLDYWQGKGDFDQQLKSWCSEMVKYVNDPHFTEKKALEYYNHYFGENKGESNINIYVDEIIEGLTQNGKINFEILNQSLPKIKKIANIYGGNSSEIIESLILARAKLIDPTKKQELMEQANEEKVVDGSSTIRLNQLNPDEERLLEWLNPVETQVEETVNQDETTPEKVPTVVLTNELAKTNPELYKKSLLEKIKKENPKMYSIWELLCKNNRTSVDKLIINSKTWYSESDAKDGITLGTAPMEEGAKYAIIYNDSKFNYEDEVVYRFSHEMSHKIIHYLAETKNQKSEFNYLLSTLDLLRSQPDNRGVSSLASLKTYKDKGVRIQAEEDMTEMVNMYLQDPNYLKNFFNFLSDGKYSEIRAKYSLTHLSPGAIKNLFETVERGLKPLFDELDDFPNNKLAQPVEKTTPLSIKIIDYSDKPIDASQIKQIIDQPVVVRVTDLPEKSLVIDLDQTAFDIIGEPSRFLKTDLTENVSASKLVLLPSLSTQDEKFYYFTVAKHNDNNTVSYSNCFVANKNGAYQPVGHIDYTTRDNDPSKGICHMSNLHETLQAIPSDKLPPHLKTFQSIFPNGLRGVAVETETPYRSQKLGKALWHFSLAQGELDGLKEIEIVGDITVYNDPQGQVRSFYQHLGAQPQLYLQYNPEQDKVEGGERLVASTFLDYSQISKVKKLLEPIKIKIS